VQYNCASAVKSSRFKGLPDPGPDPDPKKTGAAPFYPGGVNGFYKSPPYTHPDRSGTLNRNGHKASIAKAA
jgi:hypothetical protein